MDMELESSSTSCTSGSGNDGSIMNIISNSNSPNNSLTCNQCNNNDGDHNVHHVNVHVNDDKENENDNDNDGDCTIEILNEKEYSIKDIQEQQQQQQQQQHQVQLEEEEQQTVGLEPDQVQVENNNVNVTMNIFKFDEAAEADLTTESRMEGITSQCYEGNLSIFSGETVVFDQTPNCIEEEEDDIYEVEDDDDDDENEEEICSIDSNSLHEDTVQRFAKAKKEIMDAFLIIKSQYDVIADFRKLEIDEMAEMNAELEEGLRAMEAENEKQKDLQVRVEAMRTKLAQKNSTTPETQRLEAEYKKVKESHERAVKALQDEMDLSENLKLFHKTYGINLGLVADDTSLKALILQNLDPNDENRPFYIYFDKLNPSGFKAIKISPDFPNSQELLRKSNEDQDFVYLLFKIKEFWIESCTKQS